MKQKLLKTMLLLCALVVGSGSVWAQGPDLSSFVWSTPIVDENFNDETAAMATATKNPGVTNYSAMGEFNCVYNNSTSNKYGIEDNTTLSSKALKLQAGSGSPVIAAISGKSFATKGAYSFKITKASKCQVGLYNETISGTLYTKAKACAYLQQNDGTLSISDGSSWVSVGSFTSTDVLEICVIYNSTNTSASYGDDVALASKTAHIYVNGSCVMNGANPKAFTIPGVSALGFRVAPIAKSDNVAIIDDLKIYDALPTFANFTITKSASNGTISTQVSSSEVTSAAEDATVTITATPNTGYSFSSWSVTKTVGGEAVSVANASANPTTFTMPAEAVTVAATFTIKTHNLDLTSTNGTCTVTVDGDDWDGSSAIAYGAAVEIMATPSSGYLFDEWDHTLTSPTISSNVISFSMPDDDVVIEAKFADASSVKSITISDAIEHGTVTANVNTASEGDIIELTATPDAGYQFSSWTVKNASTNDDITVEENMFEMPDANVTVSATFSEVVAASVSLDITSTTIYLDATTATLTPTVLPANTLNKTVTWESSDESIATVSGGVVTPVSSGNATITVRTANGLAATCTVTVATAPKGSQYNPYTVTEAKALIDDSGTTSDVCVKGIVCNGGSNLNNGKLTYWISDDGTTTNRFQIYRGLGVDGASFSGTSDIQVGDKVTVSGEITLYNSTTYEFNEGSEIKSFFRMAVSDLTLTSSTPVALEMTSATPHPTSTITWTTSSEGTMTFTSSDESVATVSAAGVITAIGAGSATITFSQAADEAYKASTEKTVSVNVTDNRSACATDIDLSSAKTITKGDGPTALSASSTKADGFTGEITYSYVSANSSIFNIADGNYTGAGVGTTTITVTANPTGGNADNYKPASQEVAVTVNGTNSISLDQTSKTQAYSTGAFNIVATIPTENYDGTISAESSNTAIATVSIEGNTITVNPVAVGTATITVTSEKGTYYLAKASETCALTVTAPEGSTTAPASDVTTTFSDKDLNHNVGGLDWTASIDANSFESSNSERGVQFGAAKGEFTMNLTNTKKVKKVSFVMSTNGTGNTIAVQVGSTAFKNNDNTSVTLTSGMSNGKLEFTGEATGNIVVSCNDANKSIYFKSITVAYDPTATVSINKYGFATYCSVNPMDFSSTEGYTAWRVSDVSGNGTITFEKITESIKGGQGVLLYNKDADGESTSNVTVTFANGTTEFNSSQNKLFGTTAPTYVGANEYFGLSADHFVKVNAGTVKAGKALLPYFDKVSGIKSFTFIFNDSATGITESRTVSREVVETIFDLNGRRLSKPQRGINIVNGRKVVVK